MMASRGLSCVRSSYASGTNLHVVGEGASTTRQWQAAATVQICSNGGGRRRRRIAIRQAARSRLRWCARAAGRSEEHTSELQSLMRISYTVFCLKKKKLITTIY